MVDYLTLCVMIPTLIYWIFTFHRACYPCGSSPRINMTNYVSRAVATHALLIVSITSAV